MIEKPRVLVVQGYTDYKKYCRFLIDRSYAQLSYKNKELMFITDINTPSIKKGTTGEEICALVRQKGIERARKEKFDFIYQLDVDFLPDPNTLERLIAVDGPIVGGMVAARGNANEVIGHNYTNRNDLTREPLRRYQLKNVVHVGGTSGADLLIRCDVFSRIDLKDYTGPDMIAGRYTAEDEFYQIKAYRELGVVPLMRTDVRGWHYDEDGFTYRNWGMT